MLEEVSMTSLGYLVWHLPVGTEYNHITCADREQNRTRHEHKSDRYCLSKKVCPEFHSSLVTKPDRYSIVHFRLNLTDIPYFIFYCCYLCCSGYCLCVNVYCHRVTTQLQLINIYYILSHLNRYSTKLPPSQLPPSPHQTNYNISSHIRLSSSTTVPTYSTWSPPILRLLPLQFFILHQFHFSPPPHQSFQLLNTSNTPPSFAPSQFEQWPHPMSLPSSAEAFRWSLRQPTNIDSSWQPLRLGHLTTGRVLQWRPRRLLYTVPSHQLRKVDGTLTRAVGRWLLFTKARKISLPGAAYVGFMVSKMSQGPEFLQQLRSFLQIIGSRNSEAVKWQLNVSHPEVFI
jgi:hypothetical protein